MKNVLIIDSGVTNHPIFEKAEIYTTGFRDQKGLADVCDNVGHGTAIFSLVAKKLNMKEIHVYVWFTNGYVIICYQIMVTPALQLEPL